MSTIISYNAVMAHKNYFPGDAYENDITNAASELCAYIIASILYTQIGARKFFFSAYILAAIGGIGILIVD